MGWLKFKFWLHDNWPKAPLFMAVFGLMAIAVCNIIVERATE